jgi:hypothetical protein
VVVVGGGNDIDADEALEKAQAFVEDAQSYRYELLDTRRVTVGDPAGAGSDTTTRALTTGEVVDSEHWHVVEQDGYDTEFTYETIRDGETVFSNWAMTLDDEGIDVPGWTAGAASEVPTMDELVEMYTWEPEASDDEEHDEIDRQYDAEQRLDLALASYMLPISEDPGAVKRLIVEASDPVVEEQLADGGVRLRTRLAPVPELAELADPPAPPVDLLLDLDETGRPVLAQFTAGVEGASSEIEVRYRDWGSQVDVIPPPDDDVDHTPWLEEEVLAANPGLLVAPAELPSGWALSNVSTSSFEDMFGLEPDEQTAGCRMVDLGYGTLEDLAVDEEDLPPEDIEAYFEQLDYIGVTVTTAECAEAAEEHWSGPASYFGMADPAETKEVAFEDLVVMITSSLDDPGAIDRMAGSLRRVTVDELVAMVPPEAIESMGYDVSAEGGGSEPISVFGVKSIPLP